MTKASKATGIHDLITGLPQGYATQIGNLFDDSRELSWGEWQKLALSRALFRDAPGTDTRRAFSLLLCPN